MANYLFVVSTRYDMRCIWDKEEPLKYDDNMMTNGTICMVRNPFNGGIMRPTSSVATFKDAILQNPGYLCLNPQNQVAANIVAYPICTNNSI